MDTNKTTLKKITKADQTEAEANLKTITARDDHNLKTEIYYLTPSDLIKLEHKEISIITDRDTEIIIRLDRTAIE